MPIKQELEAIKALIDTPDKWVQGQVAAFADGTRASVFGEGTCRFCLLGASMRTKASIGAENHLMQLLGKRVGSRDIVAFNDSSTHHEVMVMLDIAIREAPNEA